jgi:hypothetical protein
MHYLIVVLRDGGWRDEGYSTTEDDKDHDLMTFRDIFGLGNVRLVSKDEWDEEHVMKEYTDGAYQRLKQEQDDAYEECLAKDRAVVVEKNAAAAQFSETLPSLSGVVADKPLDVAKKEPSTTRPTSLEDLRARRLKHFDYSSRRMTRSSARKLGASFTKDLK